MNKRERTAHRLLLRSPSAGGGFTLVELLVVIAIIALLMAILLPALGRAREMGKRAVCMNQIKQLQVAWNMYCDTPRKRCLSVIYGIPGLSLIPVHSPPPILHPARASTGLV